MNTLAPLVSREQIDQLLERASEVVEYRKSGLSLNHAQGWSTGQPIRSTEVRPYILAVLDEEL